MGIKIVTKNKRASYDYFLSDNIEAGIVLKGTEVKSIREGKCQIDEAYIEIDGNFEVWINNMYIAQYAFGNVHNHQENKKRKLLLKYKQIVDLHHLAAAGSKTIIALSVYFKDSKVKLEIALGKGKKHYDKRETEKEKDVERKLRRGDYE